MNDNFDFVDVFEGLSPEVARELAQRIRDAVEREVNAFLEERKVDEPEGELVI